MQQINVSIQPGTPQLITALLRPDEVFELRLVSKLGRQVKTVSNGYFNNALILPDQATVLFSGDRQLYFTINPVRRDLFYTTRNSLGSGPCWQTIDGDVIRRAALVVRFEAAEKNKGEPLATAESCVKFLSRHGWPKPVLASHDGGMDLLYRVDLLNTPANTQLIQQILLRLGKQFEGVDTSAVSAALLLPFYSSTEILMPATLEPLPNELLKTLIDLPVSEVKPVPVAPANDVLTRFVSQACVLDADAWTPSGSLPSIRHSKISVRCTSLRRSSLLASPGNWSSNSN